MIKTPPPPDEAEVCPPPPCAVDTLNEHINALAQLRDGVIAIENGVSAGWLDKATETHMREAIEKQVHERAERMTVWNGQT